MKLKVGDMPSIQVQWNSKEGKRSQILTTTGQMGFGVEENFPEVEENK